MTADQSSQKLCQGVGSWIVSTAHAFRKAMECELSQEGITFRQWEVLVWLNSDGEQPQNELAEKMGLETQTLGGILSRMERDGWLTRQSCSEDRRRKLIRATAKAEKILEDMHACCDRVREQAIQGLSEADLNQLNETCEQIRKNLDHECPEASAKQTEPISPPIKENSCPGSIN